MVIKAVIFDLYGTLIKSDVGDLDKSLESDSFQSEIIDDLLKKYSLDTSLTSSDILSAFKSEIAKSHQLSIEQGVFSPEVVIENVWNSVFDGLKFDSKSFAYDFYNMSGERGLYPNTKELLAELNSNGIHVGIISNAQSYTLDDMNNLLGENMFNSFDRNLCLFSYELGFSKPNPNVFSEMTDRLRAEGVKPSEAIFIGNHALKDIKTAQEAGYHTCLVINPETVYLENVVPEYQSNDLLEILSIVREIK